MNVWHQEIEAPSLTTARQMTLKMKLSYMIRKVEHALLAKIG